MLLYRVYAQGFFCKYFRSRLRDPSAEVASQMMSNGTTVGVDTQSVLESKFNNVMTLCAMVPLLVFTCLNSILHQRIPQKVRITGSLTAILGVFLMTAIIVKVELEPLPFFVITMIKIVCINSFGAVLQGSLFGMAGLLPTSYTAPIMSGQGLAGTFAAFSMICALASGSELQDSSFGYFITACLVILLAIASYLTLPKMEFFQYYQKNKAKSTYHDDNKMELMKKDIYFIPVSCFLLFNIMDWAGRSLTAVCLWPGKNSKLLPLLLLARMLFVPLFMLCNVQPRSNLPVFFSHDAWFIFFMILFAFSNGYLASLCMCFGPKKVEAHEAETAGAIMAFFLSLGLALGASISFVFRGLI
ncbi:equilibrative nucleoside transporter 1-like [Scleropages formosus]|uniref:Equilibrative nucleoside transporter 1-like n=1 Tax=Scleropages formosus TaxID=113540 RepID=A0A0P7XRD8_SCLFO|nr:equilibrative nucleoside transporter 1-like [Scleropages formosus]